VLVAPGREPEQPRYETTTWEAIAAILVRRSASAIDIHAQGARISLAGQPTAEVFYEPHTKTCIRLRHRRRGEAGRYERLERFVASTTKKLAARIATAS
jgi:hypothetical protein